MIAARAAGGAPASTNPGRAAGAGLVWMVVALGAGPGLRAQRPSFALLLTDSAEWAWPAPPSIILPLVQDTAAGRPSYFEVGGAAALGSLVGGTVAFIVAVESTATADWDDLAWPAFLGSWVGGALGGAAAGGNLRRAFAGSAAGMVLGNALGAATSSPWVYLITHGAVTAAVILR